MLNNAQIQAMLISQSASFFYNKDTGKVVGFASGGGALESLRGDALIYATFTMNVDPTTILGVIESYFVPLSGKVPDSVNLGKVATWKSACDAYLADKDAKNGGMVDFEIAAEMCRKQDEAVIFIDE